MVSVYRNLALTGLCDEVLLNIFPPGSVDLDYGDTAVACTCTAFDRVAYLALADVAWEQKESNYRRCWRS